MITIIPRYEDEIFLQIYYTTTIGKTKCLIDV